jgi:hypothetical protein
MRSALFFSFLTCLLFCVIASAEIPELTSLKDDVSNDFTLCGRASAQSAHVSSTAEQCALEVFRGAVVFAEEQPTTLEDTSAGSPHTAAALPLFILNSILRR